MLDYRVIIGAFIRVLLRVYLRFIWGGLSGRCRAFPASIRENSSIENFIYFLDIIPGLCYT